MLQRPACPSCGRRRPERFCPAQGEKICAVCCGTEREVTLDCPADCSYLIAAHRYEQEHRKPLEACAGSCPVSASLRDDVEKVFTYTYA